MEERRQRHAETGGECTEDALNERFRLEICNAIELLTFAVERGKKVADSIIEGIEKARKFLGTATPGAKDRVDFEKAFRDLAQFMWPVTVETLHATDDRRLGYRRRFTGWLKLSDARLFYWKLWCWSLACIVVLLFLQIVNAAYVPDEENARTWASWVTVGGKVVAPFLYGLLGACTYLLRCAHGYISGRSFDLRRIPEYSNRMLLGAIAGGVVLLFVDPKSIGFTQEAIALAVGYNTDALFELLERVGSAVTGKSTPPQPSQQTAVPDSTKNSTEAASTPGVASCTVSTSKSPTAGSKGYLTLTLNAAAPDAGVSVSLDCTPAGAIAFKPSPVTIPAGSTSCLVMFTVASSSKGQVTITATAGDSSATDQIDVL